MTPRHSTLRQSLTFITLPLLSAGVLLLAPTTAEASPDWCGGLDQRPCNIWEAFPSCDGNLVENFLTNRCEQSSPWIPPPPPACGALNTRPCFFWERVPSCDGNLVEDFILNQCVNPPPQLQPSLGLPCGEEDERPCTVIESIPSCRTGLKESFGNPNLCVPLGPGEWSPFFAGLEGLNATFQNLGTYARDACRTWSKAQVDAAQPQPFGARLTSVAALTGGAVTVDPKCSDYAAAGFVCETPTLIEMFDLGIDHTFFTNLQARFNDAYSSTECAGQADVATRAGCAAGKLVFDSVLPPAGTVRDMQCFVAAVQRQDVWEALLSTSGVTLDADTCMDIGVALFDLAMLAVESRGKFAQGGASKGTTATWFENRRSQYANTPVGARLDAGAKTGFMRARDTVNAALEALGTAEQVASILDTIPECVDPTNPQAVVADATFYRVDADGDLHMSRHGANGLFNVLEQEIGWGWGTMSSIFAVEGNYVYTIDNFGTLKLWHHDGAGNWDDWNGTEIGWYWDYEKVFAGRYGEIYAIDGDGDLVYFEHDGNHSWSYTNYPIGSAWDPVNDKIFSGGHGAIYMITEDGDLLYYYHDENFQFIHSALQIGTGWDAFATVGSTGNGELYAVTTTGELLFYRHDVHKTWLAGSGGMIGWDWPSFGNHGIIPAAY